jgi:hypothetical protein
MGVAITLCHKTEHERRENKHDHSFFHRSEAQPLPRLIQFETLAFCNHESTPIGTNSKNDQTQMTNGEGMAGKSLADQSDIVLTKPQ